jgi:hypothetical protein
LALSPRNTKHFDIRFEKRIGATYLLGIYRGLY